MIRDCIEAQRHSPIPALMLKWIAMFEEHPDPASCCEVDYKAIYMYISSLLDVSLVHIFLYQRHKTHSSLTGPYS